jgi:hypothetical protein
MFGFEFYIYIYIEFKTKHSSRSYDDLRIIWLDGSTYVLLKFIFYLILLIFLYCFDT